MERLVLHIGLDKCASTSIQSAFASNQSICYPVAGRNLHEHLGLALQIRGLDSYTRQYYDQGWVDSSWTELLQEISSATQTIVLSSERLAGCSLHEINTLREHLNGFKVEILLLVRNPETHAHSRWRHLVYRHDYASSYSDFLTSFGKINIQSIEETFSQFFPLTKIDIDDISWQSKLEAFIGCSLKIKHDNLGLKHDVAEALSKIHRAIGSKTFQELFPPQFKEALAEASHVNGKIINTIEHSSALLDVCGNHDHQNILDPSSLQRIADPEGALLKLKILLLERKALKHQQSAYPNIALTNATPAESLTFRLAEAAVQLVSLRQMLVIDELSDSSPHFHQ